MPVAQWLERAAHNSLVAGSNPARHTKISQASVDMPKVRFRSSGDSEKQAARSQELITSSDVLETIVIAKKTDGNYEFLTQGMSLDGICKMLMLAAETVSNIQEGNNSLTFEAHHQPENVGAISGPPLRKKCIRVDEDGTLVPPSGENIISCGECQHPRWYITLHNNSQSPARFACAHCGNEVAIIPIHSHHTPGRA